MIRAKHFREHHQIDGGSSEKIGEATQRAQQESPSSKRMQPVWQLQQQVGNQTVQELLRSRFIQAKLAVSNPGDPAEREADHVADTIMRSDAGASLSSPCSCSDDGAMGEEGHQERSQPTIHRSASAPAAPSHVPRIVGDVLRSSGHPLDPATRAFFEPRFGHDFSHVRIHTGPEAAESARSIQAHAYTSGSDIVFAPGRYSPESTSGRTLLAHELTHVLQQRAPNHSNSVIHRSPGPRGEVIFPPTTFSTDSPKERSKWRTIVDHAVRTQFHLTGPGITDAQVSYESPKDFGALFKGQTLEDALLTVFLDENNVAAKNILLSDARVAYLARYRDPVSSLGMMALREFIQEGIKKNSFQDSGGGPLDVQTGKPMYPPSTITPAELAASEFAGLTTGAGPGIAPHIHLLREMPPIGHSAFVGVFVHEACHFYAHPAYNRMIKGIKNPDNIIGGARISQILAEGVPEFFAREVSTANREDFGALIASYPLETEQATLLISFLGEQTVRDAYFKGNAKDLELIMSLAEAGRINGKFPEPIEAEKLLEPSRK
jgi:hypothetical protein